MNMNFFSALHLQVRHVHYNAGLSEQRADLLRQRRTLASGISQDSSPFAGRVTATGLHGDMRPDVDRRHNDILKHCKH
jgi:hypothetical protein